MDSLRTLIVRYITFPVIRWYWNFFSVLRTTVKVVIIHGGKFLMVQGRHDGIWTFPGGGAQRGEEATDAAYREVLEELGLSLSNLTYVGSFASPKINTIQVYVSYLDVDEKISAAPWEIEHWRWVDSIANIPQPLSPRAMTILEMVESHIQ